MKRFSILIILVASLPIIGVTHANPAPETAKPAKAAIRADDALTSKTMVTTKPAQMPTLEQVEQQMQSLYLEAGARIERIRVAQGELEQINQQLQQLIQIKTQLTGKMHTASATVKTEGK